ncbi:hypothetical protein BN11_4280008 [Nostocoides australiense Ben110]|uniref:Uncharacterized protein n=1 Tax=Nostocoides australiense Ben110 TaxID=1193182 RepID=W6JYV8_9MICO|nr:hypothetical protein BN11_4280008 [Tetrasphaera australiensis Ben110]
MACLPSVRRTGLAPFRGACQPAGLSCPALTLPSRGRAGGLPTNSRCARPAPAGVDSAHPARDSCGSGRLPGGGCRWGRS